MDARSDTDIESLRAEMEQLRADLAKVGETLNTIVSGRAEAAYERVRGATEKAAAQASHAAESVGNEISTRPFTSVATAFLVGAMIGMMASRRS